MTRVLCIWLPNWPIQRRLVEAQSTAANSTAMADRKLGSVPKSTIHRSWKPKTQVKSIANGLSQGPSQAHTEDRSISDSHAIFKYFLVLFLRDPRRGQLVAACSAAAAEQGVRVGMPLAEAKALSRVSGDFSAGQSEIWVGSKFSARTQKSKNSSVMKRIRGNVFQQYDPHADRAALEKLALWCEQFSPLVGLELAAEPSSLLLDTTGLASLFGSETELACRVVESFRHRGYFVRVGLADTIGAAWAISHASGNSAEETGSFSIVPSDDEKSILTVLGPLPLTALRLPDQTIELLHSLGVQSIEQLVELPRADLGSRFGNILSKRLDQAFGSFDETITTHRPAPEFQAEESLEHPTHRREMIDYVLVQLVRHVVTLLDQYDRGVIELECKLMMTTLPHGVVDFDSNDSACSTSSFSRTSKFICIRVGLFQPIAKVSYLLDLIRLQLERRDLPGLVTKVSVQALCTAPLEVSQQELFTDDQRQTQRQLGLLVERLSSRLGKQNILRACLRAEAQPERAIQYVPLTGRRKKFPATMASKQGAPRLQTESVRQTDSNSQTPDGDTSTTSRPLRIFSPPSKLNVIAITPDGPPLRFHYETRPYQIVHHWGPERIETGWWRGHSVCRDYYRVETSQGHRFWLFRRLGDSKWFLQGIFE